jgi:hypothetical protein
MCSTTTMELHILIDSVELLDQMTEIVLGLMMLFSTRLSQPLWRLLPLPKNHRNRLLNMGRKVREP